VAGFSKRGTKVSEVGIACSFPATGCSPLPPIYIPLLYAYFLSPIHIQANRDQKISLFTHATSMLCILQCNGSPIKVADTLFQSFLDFVIQNGLLFVDCMSQLFKFLGTVLSPGFQKEQLVAFVFRNFVFIFLSFRIFHSGNLVAKAVVAFAEVDVHVQKLLLTYF